MYRSLLFIIFSTYYCYYSYCQNISDKYPVLKGEYFGQKPPDLVPEPFLSEVFNMYKFLHGKLAFSPCGKEAVWVITSGSVKGGDFDKRFIIKQNKNGIWSPPEESFLEIKYRENGPSYSSDGKKLFYQSRAPINNNDKNGDIDIWYREREGDSWSKSKNIGVPINSQGDESQPSVAIDGSIYFCRDNINVIKDESGKSDIFFSEYSKDGFLEPVILGPEINSEFVETEPAISPDNSYLLFISNRPGGFSRMMNLYVSFRKKVGGWTKAKCISHELNIENIWFPTLSFDGKYLFFCGGYPVKDEGYINSKYYWISTEFIKKLNPENNKPEK